MGTIISIGFVSIVLGVVTLLEKLKILQGEFARKAIHIIVAHWWFIAMYFYVKPAEAAIVPALFIVINYFSFKKHWIKSMERNEDFKNLGTVYYAISLFVLAIWSFGIERPEIGGLGILIMGYSDGLAAVVGKKWGRHPLKIFSETKSVEGSLTAFLAALLVVVGFNTFFSMGYSLLDILLLASVATILEAITPLGFDNLTVPIGISVLAYVIL